MDIASIIDKLNAAATTTQTVILALAAAFALLLVWRFVRLVLFR